ncbi:MAG: galactokinase [Ktedonobacterales bacterium]|nr:galactokinase [Ktedonobacterales bacterium]
MVYRENGKGEAMPAQPMPAPVSAAVAAYHALWADEAGNETGTAPLLAAWAPGRINLIGEHTDYNDGWVLPVAVDRHIAFAGRALPGGRARIYSAHFDEVAEFETIRAALVDVAEGAGLPLWARFVRGALAELAALPHAPLTPGFRAAIVGDVPVGGGMSSSTALVVATATFAAALGGPRLTPMETARLCQRAEQRSSGVLGGIMDQVSACLGRAGYALLLDCRTQAYAYIPLSLTDVALVAYDTGVPHLLAESAYNQRRAECLEVVGVLAAVLEAETPGRSVRALRDVVMADLQRHGALLSPTLLARARHVVSENARVERAAAVLRAGEMSALGALLSASHASLRDDYAVSCPELDAVVAIARTVPGVVGARMMGAGFGGSALIVVERAALDRLEATLADEYPRRTGRLGTWHRCRVAGGATSGAL